MKIAFTVDFEDWYQGIDLPTEQWGSIEKRLHIGHYKLLELFQRYNVKATYFLLGKTIEDHPKFIDEIIKEGHEIGCHTYSHPFLFRITPEKFREELRRCKQLINQFGITYTGFRAPYFSIDERSFWALDIIREEGFVYDSSIFPGDAKRTGMPGFNPKIHELKNGLTEFPMSTVKIGGLDFGVGGGYFRLLPYNYFKRKLERILAYRSCIFYVHPWELDIDQPKISGIPRRIKFTHYVNLQSTEKKIIQLLSDFECTNVSDIISTQYDGQQQKLYTYRN
jgi:polysaccharide deacetylase family protein (PEP-CTERM system associated)